MKKVSIFIAGVQKGGTTSLFNYLCSHSQLSPPVKKELHFFDDESKDWINPDFAPLEAAFSARDGALKRFEATPIYSFWPPSIERIRLYNPSAKLILVFRDPFERAWSQWCMEYARGHETLPFADAIRLESETLHNLPHLAFDQKSRVASYLSRGRYAEQVVRLLKHFPRDQLLFLKSEDLLSRHVDILGQVTDFLDVSPIGQIQKRTDNARPSMVTGLTPLKKDRDFAVRILQQDLDKFSILTGLDVADWPTNS